MRHLLTKAALLFAVQGLTSAYAGDVNVGVSISGEISPGVYGRVDINNMPPPPVVYTEPVVIVKQPRPVAVAPIYMHVPPGHAKNWAKHCHKYNACSQPVYFVKSAEYEPNYRREEPEGRGKGKRDRDDHGGKGHGGKGHGKHHH